MLMKPVGIKKLQVYGFVLIAIAFLLMAVMFQPLKDRNPDLLFSFYCLLLFFLTFGPNVTTYVLSAEVYPKEIRATFNGISAALGKVGEMIFFLLFFLNLERKSSEPLSSPLSPNCKWSLHSTFTHFICAFIFLLHTCQPINTT